MEEIAATARDLSRRSTVMFVVDTLEFLHKGGRIGGAKRLVGSLLSMKPILTLTDGKIDALDSVRTKKKAVQTMLSILRRTQKERRRSTFQFSTVRPKDEVIKLMEQIKESYHLKPQ